jgi:D-aminoacyl-tRNA deacylase
VFATRAGHRGARGVAVIALIQRVLRAEVEIDGAVVGAIQHGVLALVGVQRDDGRAAADRLLERILTYRIFADTGGRMNLHLGDVGGGLLLVPQFTLAADTRSGTRPGFSTAAAPEAARALFEYVVEQALARHSPVATGRFGAHMRVGLVNDGPVTFWLESASK